MKALLLIMALFFLVGVVCAQTDRAWYKNQIKLSPVRLVDPINPGVELGYERAHSERYSIQISAAYIKDIIGVGTFDELEGYRISLEEKRFFNRKKLVPTYLAAELVYYHATFKDEAYFGIEMPWLEPMTFTENYVDPYSAEKRMVMFHLNLGAQIVVNHLLFEASTGLGLKYKVIKHFDRAIPTGKMERPRSPNANYMASVEGERITVNLPINIKVGVAF